MNPQIPSPNFQYTDNASGTIAGEIAYLIRSTLRPSTQSCAACTLTHSFAELGERRQWRACKSDLKETLGVDIEQLHLNELPPALQQWLARENLRAPVLVLARETGTAYELLMDHQQLSGLRGDIDLFSRELLGILRSKQLIA